MRIRPECRYCGATVRSFGDLCKDCRTSENEEMDQADIDLIDRMAYSENPIIRMAVLDQRALIQKILDSEPEG